MPGNISSLFDALVKAGVVSASGTPTGAGATAKAETPTTDASKDAIVDYRQAIFSAGIKLSSNDIVKYVGITKPHHEPYLLSLMSRQRPPIVKFLYDSLPCQCKQCGVRFRDDTVGRKKLQDHLDTHFRQNRKANQAASRGYSRSWFISIDVSALYGRNPVSTQ